MMKVRNEWLIVAFIDMDKAYNRVNNIMKKLFGVMRGYGVQLRHFSGCDREDINKSAAAI